MNIYWKKGNKANDYWKVCTLELAFNYRRKKREYGTMVLIKRFRHRITWIWIEKVEKKDIAWNAAGSGNCCEIKNSFGLTLEKNLPWQKIWSEARSLLWSLFKSFHLLLHWQQSRSRREWKLFFISFPTSASFFSCKCRNEICTKNISACANWRWQIEKVLIMQIV